MICAGLNPFLPSMIALLSTLCYHKFNSLSDTVFRGKVKLPSGLSHVSRRSETRSPSSWVNSIVLARPTDADSYRCQTIDYPSRITADPMIAKI